MFSAVGDFAYDRWGKNHFSIRTVGPIKNSETISNYTHKYEAEIYNAPVSEVLLYSISLEYSDGTSEIIYYNHSAFKKSKYSQ